VAKRILVTGAAGFIGSHTVEALLARGDEVVGVDSFDPYYDPALKRANVAEIRARSDGHRFDFRELDIRDAVAVAKLCAEKPLDGIVHLAALAGVRASIGHAALYYEVNVTGTIHLLDAARDYNVPSFVFASTSSVYGNTTRIPFVEDDACDRPLAPYPASKRSAELLGYAYHNIHGLNVTALRFFTVYGPRNRPDMMAYKLLESMTRGKTVPLYNGGDMRRDWTFVKDIAQGIAAAVDRPLGFEIINLGRGEPMPAADMTYTFADISKAQRLLGYAPRTNVQAGVQELWDWYRAAAR
jgi:UDP-glucuronate 4-epimerase